MLALRAARAALVLATAASAVLASKPAAADETDVCLESHVSAQKARKEGSLLVAHLALQRCERDTCPGQIREECAAWRKEIESVLGTVEVSVEVGPLGDASRARVTIDGAEPLVPVGPSRFLTTVGRHTVEARTEDGASARAEVMVAPMRVAKATLDLRAQHGASPDDPTSGRPIPPLTLAGAVVTGVGGVGLLTFAIAGGLGAAAYGDLDACRPRCAQSQVDDVDQKLLAADVGLGLGLGLAAVGVVLIIVGEVTDEPAPKGPIGFRF
ncbi:MAG: hypothetical protein JNL21_35880 [Myxococcales bacterium]|nr:hypothetical protein [Myxococcales bacterium]